VATNDSTCDHCAVILKVNRQHLYVVLLANISSHASGTSEKIYEAVR
jgi:hypothetical protein